MSVRITVSFELDLDEWDEGQAGLIPYAVRGIMETTSQRMANALTSTGCDLYGRYPINRADGVTIGSWDCWNASAEDAGE